MAKKIYRVGKREIDIDGDKKPDIVVTTYTQASTRKKAPVTMSISSIVENVVEPEKNKCKTKTCKQLEGYTNYQGYCGDCARCFKII